MWWTIDPRVTTSNYDNKYQLVSLFIALLSCNLIQPPSVDQLFGLWTGTEGLRVGIRTKIIVVVVVVGIRTNSSSSSRQFGLSSVIHITNPSSDTSSRTIYHNDEESKYDRCASKGYKITPTDRLTDRRTRRVVSDKFHAGFCIDRASYYYYYY